MQKLFGVVQRDRGGRPFALVLFPDFLKKLFEKIMYNLIWWQRRRIIIKPKVLLGPSALHGWWCGSWCAA